MASRMKTINTAVYCCPLLRGLNASPLHPRGVFHGLFMTPLWFLHGFENFWQGGAAAGTLLRYPGNMPETKRQ